MLSVDGIKATLHEIPPPAISLFEELNMFIKAVVTPSVAAPKVSIFATPST